jgi:transcriptional regulator with XRE-family HTH domain
MTTESGTHRRIVSAAAGAQIRAVREAHGLTLAGLSNALPSGIAKPTLCQYETGGTSMTLDRFVEICQALGVSPVSVLAASLPRATRRGAHNDDHAACVAGLMAAVKDAAAAQRRIRQFAHSLTGQPTGTSDQNPDQPTMPLSEPRQNCRTINEERSK